MVMMLNVSGAEMRSANSVQLEQLYAAPVNTRYRLPVDPIIIPISATLVLFFAQVFWPYSSVERGSVHMDVWKASLSHLQSKDECLKLQEDVLKHRNA
jgi:hypothetical protein